MSNSFKWFDGNDTLKPEDVRNVDLMHRPDAACTNPDDIEYIKNLDSITPGPTPTPGVLVGVVSDSDTAFPTKRPDDTPLENQDYVMVDANSTLPFTIDTVTFTAITDTAFYFEGAWYLKPYSGVLSVNGKTGAVILVAGDIQGSDGTTLQELVEKMGQLQAAVNAAESYKTQAGNYALDARESKEAILNKIVECDTIEEYIQKIQAGTISRDTYVFIKEPELEVL